MPTVPTYNGPQLRSNALPGAFQQTVDADAFGAAGGRQLSQAGQALGQAAVQFDRIAERQALDDAFRVETTVKEEWIKTERQLRQRRGKDAEGLAKEAEAWWDKAAQDFGADLSPRAKAAISRSLGRARVSALSGVAGYEDQERQRAFIDSTTANIGVEIDRVVQSGNPAEVPAARAVIERNVAALAANQGWDAARVELEMRKQTSTLHVRVLDSLVDTSPERAAAYLAENRDQIDSGVLKRVDDMVTGAANEQKAATTAASMAALPYDEQLAKASEITDPDLRKRTLARVKENQQNIQTAQLARERQASDAVWQMVANGASLNQLPKAVLAQMDGKERLAVNEHYRAARERARTEAGGGSVKTDFTVYERLVNLPPEEFMQVRLTQFQDKLSRGDLEQLINRQAKLRNPAEAGQAATAEQQMTTYSSTLELKGEKLGMFKRAAYDEFEQFRQGNKREPNYKERQEILDRLTMQSDGGWFGGSYRLFERPRTQENMTRFVDQVVPQSERELIIKEFTSRGIRPTSEMILDAYRRANPQ